MCVNAHIGLDIGSTTVKIIILDSEDNILYSQYERHFSQVRATVALLIEKGLVYCRLKDKENFTLTLTGSGSISLSQEFHIDFIQEVIASTTSLFSRLPQADVCIELGGEDSKIIFLTQGIEQRMNEVCAGGTGAFIDQMAEYLHTDAQGLNELAKKYKTIYPIASRCGVFAKTDILPLLNESCAKEDIAVSIFQAVVDQVIGGLACGRAIKGNVAFLGGPLTFLSMLRERFIETLKLKQEQVFFPEQAEYYIALGAALHGVSQEKENLQSHVWTQEALFTLAQNMRDNKGKNTSQHLPALFQNKEEEEEFLFRHYQTEKTARKDINELTGTQENPSPLYLGLDAGSTTIKAVLVTEEGELVYSFYSSHQGDPLAFAIQILKDIYEILPENAYIATSGATGYGSALMRAALHTNVDEVETLAHFKAARFFLPDVSYILDIGGQDIKCMSIKYGMIQTIKLNEACSAGCGTFIETFSKSLNISLSSFIEEALKSQNPVDLGTRCTVFMNSKVKQAQKDGMTLGDIAAGLSYSVVKNALYKVIRITDSKELGSHIMVQGGAFHNDALLRAFELCIDKHVTRMDISGLMGAFGIALLAKENHLAKNKTQSGKKLLTQEEVRNFHAENSTFRCKKCTNRCILTLTKFADNTKVISGNRCERGSGKQSIENKLPNLYAYKYKRLFDYYLPHSPEQAWRGTVGIPRVLNIYENYPLWFTLFNSLGFQVILSSPSSKQQYATGINTIPSQTVCYPAKLAHGHLIDLIEKKVDWIFFPCLPFEKKEFSAQDNNYNCPIIGGYPELLRNNIDLLHTETTKLICPFLSLEGKSLLRNLHELPLLKDVPLKELKQALDFAFTEQSKFKSDIHQAGEKALKHLTLTHAKGIILAGHPYHVDPEINHGIPELISSMGLAVFTEDSIAHLMPDIEPLQFVDQWTFHARLYRAAYVAAQSPNLAFVQLVSFGCGLDVITSEQIESILSRHNILYTQLKIDEGFNLGAARIRIRSLLAVLNERELNGISPIGQSKESVAQEIKAPPFTLEMKKTHTILIPQMSPYHFQFFETMLNACGYKAALLPTVSKAAIEFGLKYVNNDACFPAITVIGQLLYAVQNEGYDPDKIALIISQTGGGCRATNYIGFLRKALVNLGMPQIPILSFNMSGIETNPGFTIDKALLSRGIIACLYGDIFMRLIYRIRPYEEESGSTDKLLDTWSSKAQENIRNASFMECYKNISEIVKQFDRLSVFKIPRKPQVGLVGEILLKFHPDANNAVADIIEAEGGEVVMPDLFDFFLYLFLDDIYRYKVLSGSRKKARLSKLALRFLLVLRLPVYFILKKSKHFSAPLPFKELIKKAQDIVSLGHQTGEGWLLTAEMVELIESGVKNILCMQPFGCLPNHITGRGVIKELKQRFPFASITAVDYDPSTSETNQINRIKLIMAIARKEGK